MRPRTPAPAGGGSAPAGATTSGTGGRRRTLRVVLLALVTYAATRVVSALVILRAAREQVPVSWTGSPVDYWGMSLMWDGTWYRRIAETGYPHVLPLDATGQVAQNEWAFYPLYPMLCRLVTSLTGADFRHVGAITSTLLGAVAAVLVVLLLRRRTSDGVALLAMLVWATYMATPVLQIAYTESLAMVLLVAFLLLVERRRWWGAAAVALLIGLSRPIGAPLGVVALVAVLARWRHRRTDPVSRREGAGMLAALAGCGATGVEWPALAWWGTGRRDAYTTTMAAWRSGHQIHPLRPWWDNAQYFFGDRAAWLLAAYVLGLLLLALGPWARPLGWVQRTWLLAYPAYLFVVEDPHTSLYRYLLLMFPAALVGVGGTGRVRVSTLVRAAVLVGLGVVLQVWWAQTILVLHLPSSWPP